MSDSTPTPTVNSTHCCSMGGCLASMASPSDSFSSSQSCCFVASWSSSGDAEGCSSSSAMTCFCPAGWHDDEETLRKKVLKL